MATAIHAGHGLRRSIAALTALDDATRLREEDPFTDRLAAVGGTTVMVHRSRFEVDLNRPRDASVYQVPDDAWGLDLWRAPLPADDVAAVPAAVRRLLLGAGAAAGRGGGAWAVRRVGPALLQPPPRRRRRAPAPVEREPGGQRRDRFARPGSLGSVSSTGSSDDLGRRKVAGHRLDVRENVRFRAASSAAGSTRGTTPAGCALAIEFKKVFMDEWTGERRRTPSRRSSGARSPPWSQR